MPESSNGKALRNVAVEAAAFLARVRKEIGMSVIWWVVPLAILITGHLTQI